MDDKAVLRKNKDMVHRSIAGETILLPVYRSSDEINCIYTLNRAAAWVWERIDGRKTLGQLKQEAQNAFDGTPGDIERKMLRFIEELQGIRALR